MIPGFDHGILPDHLKKEQQEKEELKKKFINPLRQFKKSAIEIEKQDIANSDTTTLPFVVDQLETTKNKKVLVSFPAVLENDSLDFSFEIFEYLVLDFAIICILDEKAFTLNPKDSQQFNLKLDNKNFPVYYIGKPQFVKTFQNSILFFLRNLENDQ